MFYFDHAATSLPKPQCVIDAVSEAMYILGNPGRGCHESALDASRIVFETRQKLAELFGAEGPNTIAFTANGTQSLNIAIKGIVCPGDHVITTALEHNSVLRPLYELEEIGVELTILPNDQYGYPDITQLQDAIKPNTKAVVCTHASNVTGNLLDIKTIGNIVKKHHLLFLVDASQTAGMISIDVQDMQIDILCFTGHKSLLGPQGTGGMYVKPGVKVRPLLTGGSGIMSYHRNHPDEMPEALEAGTLNCHGIAGLGAGIDYIMKQDMEMLYQKEQQLMWAFYHQIKEIPGVIIYGDFIKKERCPIVSINIRDYDSSKISDLLANEYGIATRPGAHCAPLMHQALGTIEQGVVRFSFSHMNTMDDVNQAVLAITEIADEEIQEEEEIWKN